MSPEASRGGGGGGGGRPPSSSLSLLRRREGSSHCQGEGPRCGDTQPGEGGPSRPRHLLKEEGGEASPAPVSVEEPPLLPQDLGTPRQCLEQTGHTLLGPALRGHPEPAQPGRPQPQVSPWPPGPQGWAPSLASPPVAPCSPQRPPRSALASRWPLDLFSVKASIQPVWLPLQPATISCQACFCICLFIYPGDETAAVGGGRCDAFSRC